VVKNLKNWFPILKVSKWTARSVAAIKQRNWFQILLLWGAVPPVVLPDRVAPEAAILPEANFFRQFAGCFIS